MDGAARNFLKNSYKLIFESLTADNHCLAEDVLIFLLLAGKINESLAEVLDPKPDGDAGENDRLWQNIIGRYMGEVNQLLPWFTDRHRELPIPDTVVREIRQGIRSRPNPAALLGAVHEIALDRPVPVTKKGSGAMVRKKQGSYYTPPEIVNYMVELTLGQILSEYRLKMQQAVRRESSSEITALLEDLAEFRVLDPACGSAAFLTAVMRELTAFYAELPACIGVNPAAGAIAHLYGTDSDARAVDLTILGLALSYGSYSEAVESKKLLQKKIRLGDALTIKWRQEFAEVFQGYNPGFSLVIGNPPYISNKLLPLPLKKYINQHYRTVDGQYDIIVPFIEKGLEILNDGGRLCFIISNKYLAADYGRKLRSELLTRHNLHQLIDLSEMKVFADAAVYPVIQVIEKGRKNMVRQVAVREVTNLQQLAHGKNSCIIPESFYHNLDDMIITSKINQATWPVLETISRIPGRLPVQKILCGIAKTGFAKLVIDAQSYDRLADKDKTNYRKFLNSGCIDKYSITSAEGFIPAGASTKKQWHSFTGRKLVISGLARKIEAAVDEEGCALGRVYYIREEDVVYGLYESYNLFYLCAVLNSKLMDFYYRILYWPVHLQGGYYRFNSTYLARLPILPEHKDRELAAEITMLAEMLQKGPVNQNIANEIDRLVFQLYGLQTKQIAVINSFLSNVDKEN